VTDVKSVVVPNVSRLSVVIVVFKCVENVAILMILCAIVLENVILVEQMLVAVQDGLVMNVEYGIVRIVRKATKILVRNVDHQNLKKVEEVKEVKTTFKLSVHPLEKAIRCELCNGINLWYKFMV
jgi:hypothetical protein